MKPIKASVDKLFTELSALIEQSRKQVAVAVNSNLSMLYWKVGKTIKEDILRSKRAEYGERVIPSLAKKLSEKYGSGWSRQQIWNCLRVAERITDQKKMAVLSRELSW